ncbi:hypothetical protein P3T22_006749, partial [Paraburkholderia sp. GAS348]
AARSGPADTPPQLKRRPALRSLGNQVVGLSPTIGTVISQRSLAASVRPSQCLQCCPISRPQKDIADAILTVLLYFFKAVLI